MIKNHFALCTLLHEQQLQIEANLIIIRFIKVHSLVISLFHPLLKLLVIFFPSITTVCQLNWIDWVDASSSSGEKNCTQCTIQPQHFGPTSLFYILSKCFLIYCPRIQLFTKKIFSYMLRMEKKICSECFVRSKMLLWKTTIYHLCARKPSSG